MSVWKSISDSIPKLFTTRASLRAKNLKLLADQFKLQRDALKLLGLPAKAPANTAFIATPALLGETVRSEVFELAKASGQDPLWVLSKYVAAGGEAIFSWDPKKRGLKVSPEGKAAVALKNAGILDISLAQPPDPAPQEAPGSPLPPPAAPVAPASQSQPLGAPELPDGPEKQPAPAARTRKKASPE